MSDTLIALEYALEILRKARYKITDNDYAWKKSYHASLALQTCINEIMEEQN